MRRTHRIDYVPGPHVLRQRRRIFSAAVSLPGGLRLRSRGAGRSDAWTAPGLDDTSWLL